MMPTILEEKYRLRLLLLAKTDRIEDTAGWVNRMAVIAEEIGLKRARMNWLQSPEAVAADITHECEKHNLLAQLERRLSE